MFADSFEFQMKNVLKREILFLMWLMVEKSLILCALNMMLYFFIFSLSTIARAQVCENPDYNKI